MPKIHRYPETYSKILLALPEDGQPLEITLATPEGAVSERLRFYNFLKFLRRNRTEAAHFAGRENRVTIIVQGPVIRFQLRTTANEHELSRAFDDALEAAAMPSPKMPEVRIATETPDAEMIAESASPEDAPPSLLDIFLDATERKKP